MEPAEGGVRDGWGAGGVDVCGADGGEVGSSRRQGSKDVRK